MGTISNGGPRTARSASTGPARLVRFLEHQRRGWLRRFPGEDLVPTDQAWRAGVAEGLRLAQVAIRRGV